jgi:integrase
LGPASLSASALFPFFDCVEISQFPCSCRENQWKIAMKPQLRLITPTIENRAVAARTPRRPKNSELRQREYLTPTEINQLIDAAKGNRYGHRDATMILIAYRHGLRAAEICDLRWSQVDLDQARLHVRRVKRGTPSVHPLQGDELRALRRLKRESPAHSDFVFMTERGGPFATGGFAFLVSRAGAKAGLPFKVHPHMLRHAAGYKLANDGHDTRSLQAYLGHRNIQHTVRYTELAANRFDAFWR